MTVLNSNNPILVENVRGEVVESFHRGSFCVVDERGDVLWSEGDIQQVSFPRSALKYFQHIPFLLSGGFDALGFTDKELAIMCAFRKVLCYFVVIIIIKNHRLTLWWVKLF